MRESTHSNFVVDTYAWVEYLVGSRAGEEARPYIEGGSGYTPSVVLAELRKWYLKEIEAKRRSEREMHIHLAFVQAKTGVISLDATLALKAGETDFVMKKRVKEWPLADSIILATAEAKAAQIVTGDPHFKHVEEVVYIGRG